jgi:hypothetical protein
MPIGTLGVVAITGKPLPGVILTLSAPRSILDGLYEASGSTGVEHAAAYVALVITALAWYAGTAFVVEDIRQQALLPVLRGASPDTQLRDEVGVRAQL